MKRGIGRLGIQPVEAEGIWHDGEPGRNLGPESYLWDKFTTYVHFSPETVSIERVEILLPEFI